MKLQVRYLLNVHNRIAIRCKLNIPDAQHNLLEYDGFVSELEDYVYWVFEARKIPELRDCIFMITNSANKRDDKKRMDGIYLSVNQDEVPQPVSRNITLIREHNKLKDEDKKIFMKEDMEDNIKNDGRGVDSKIIEKL